MGKIKLVDLAKGEVTDRLVEEEDFRKYLGGSGLAGKILYEEYNHLVDPLSEENPIIFMTGLLTGTNVPASAKCSVVTKSPLTGLWSESTVGGQWGNKLKSCGIDGVIITGKAKGPVYLWITEEGIEIKDGAHLMGKNVYGTAEELKEETDEKAEVAAIGPSGEKLSALAGIMIGGKETRAAGRGGLGAVMGAKNVKALVAGGNKKPEIYDSKSLKAHLKEFRPSLREKTKGLHDYGTAGGVQTVEANGDLPIKNWTLGSFEEGAAKTCGQYMEEKGITVSHHTCSSCPIRCGKDARVDVGPFKGDVGHGPEFETCAAFGSNIYNDDINYLVAANDMCNRFGLDTIETGNTVAMAMECIEHEVITTDDLDGINLSWGNGPALLEFIQYLAEMKGNSAKLFGNGVKAAAEKLGGIAEEFAIHVKGMSFAFHDPRAFTSMAANYATANRGACHLEALTYFSEAGGMPTEPYGFNKEIEKRSDENKAELCVIMQDYMNNYNALGLCKFIGRGGTTPDDMVTWINSVTGWDMSVEELRKAGERLHNLKRMYNVRLGISRKDDHLPPRLECHDRKTGAAAGILPHMGKLLSEYYSHRGWSEEGIPTEEKLVSLSLDHLVRDLGKAKASVK